MIAHAKFIIGVLLRNRNTKEDGLVKRVYEVADSGETMYEVAVPAIPNTWLGNHYVSDWAESILELSKNAVLESSYKPHRLLELLAR